MVLETILPSRISITIPTSSNTHNQQNSSYKRYLAACTCVARPDTLLQPLPHAVELLLPLRFRRPVRHHLHIEPTFAIPPCREKSAAQVLDGIFLREPEHLPSQGGRDHVPRGIPAFCGYVCSLVWLTATSRFHAVQIHLQSRCPPRTGCVHRI